jgi:hypothetical protein
MTADKILKKYEDDNEYHFHTVDRKWIIEAMEEYAALRQPPVIESLPHDKFCKVCNLPTDGEKCYSKRCPI